jgi:hypothetical protein
MVALAQRCDIGLVRTRLALLLVGGALALLIVPSASADRFFASGPASVRNVTAYRGLIAWGGSAGTTGPPAYYVSRGGAVTRLRISQPRYRDKRLGVVVNGSLGRIDLGPDGHGGTMAVYERCTNTCDIYRYGLASRRSGRVRGASSRRFEEFSPSVWRGRVVFFRPRQRGLFETPPFFRLARTGVAVLETDLRGRTVAYATAPSDSSATKIFVKRIGRRGRGRSCEIARATDLVTVSQPQLDGAYVYWLRQSYAGTGDLTIHRRRLPTSSCHPRGPEQLEPRGIPFDPGNFAVTRGRLFYSSTTFGAEIRYDIFEMQPVHFVNR